jgi:putative ABC transport system permease protein
MFGVSMTSIMIVLLILLAICLSSGLWVLWRQRVIFKLGMRNIPRRPAQTALIIIGLMLSTLIVSAALTTGDTLNNTITGAVYDTLGNVDELVVYSPVNRDSNDTSISSNYFSQDVATTLREKLDKNAPVDGMAPLLFESVPVVNTRNNLNEPSLSLVGVDTNDLEAFGGVKSVNGKTIDLNKLPENEIVLSKTAADKLDAEIGDPLTIYFGNQPHNVKVGAIGEDSVLTGVTDIGGDGGLSMPLAQAQQLTGHVGQISVVAISNTGGTKDGAADSDAVVSAVGKVFEGQPYRTVKIKQALGDQAQLAGNIFTSIFLVLGLFSIAAGVLLIFLIFVLLAAERKPEMGMARAVGMKRRQLTQMFLAEGIAYDLVSALVGAALGVGVAFLIVEIMGRLIGGGFNITPVASWRSLVIAYSLGVIVTFFTITISSWRVSRLNIVAAIRDLPDVQMQKAGRRWLILGILGVVIGALLMWLGRSSGQAFAFTTGVSLVPLSIAVALRRFGVPARPLYTVASLLVLFYWLAPSGWTEWMSGHLDGGMEMFFVSGIMMVSAATIAIIWNIEILTGLVSYFGRTFSRWLPAVKTAIAYPSASKGRTGMTIAMFSLIIFSLVMMATINANFVQIFTTDKAGAGWDIHASQAPNNPITDFKQTLAQHDVDASKIKSVGRVESVDGADSLVQAPGSNKETTYTVNGLSTDWIDNADAPLQTRATGYASDQVVWNAVRGNKNFAVIDSAATQAGFGSDPNTYHLSGIKQGAETMEPAKVVITDPSTGTSQTFTIIGVLDSKVSMFTGVFINADSFNAVFAKPASIDYYVKVNSGVNAKTYAQAIEGGLITYGVQADSIHEQLKEASSTSQGFLYLIEGFMGLGLLVGIAALGVVSFRSVVERRQQIGMLRAIGYQRKMVSASFLIESSMITVLGVASGTILGLTLAYQLITSPDFSGTSTGTTFVIPWLVILAFIVISVGASLLMAYIPSRQAARVPIADALRYE